MLDYLPAAPTTLSPYYTFTLSCWYWWKKSAEIWEKKLQNPSRWALCHRLLKMDPRSGLDESSAEQRRHWSNFITKFERTHGVDIFDYESLWVNKRHDNKRHPLNALSHKIIKRVKSTIIPQHIYGYRKKLKILIRNGVPFDLRAKVWW